MWCIIPRHMAAAVTARGRTAAGEHKAFNTQITPVPTAWTESFSYTENLFMGVKQREK